MPGDGKKADGLPGGTQILMVYRLLVRGLPLSTLIGKGEAGAKRRFRHLGWRVSPDCQGNRENDNRRP
jgi:hypothetical protein